MKWHDYQYKLMIFGQKRRRSIKICHYQYIPSQKYRVGTLMDLPCSRRSVQAQTLPAERDWGQVELEWDAEITFKFEYGSRIVSSN